MWGGLGCLLFIIVIGAAIGIGYYKMRGTFGSVMASAGQMEQTQQKAIAVQTALAKYKSDTGHYPPTLSALIPQYLPGPDSLHTPSDPNTDPSHVSFEYKQPADNAPGSSPLLSFHTYMNMDMAGTKEKMDTKTTYMIDGEMSQDMTQTITTPDGKTATTTSHSSGPIPPASPGATGPSAGGQ